MHIRSNSHLALAALALTALAPIAAQAQSYTFTDLGTLGATPSFGTGVNDSGQVAGSSNLNNSTGHAFLSDANGGALHDLGTLGGRTSSGRGVNATGQVTGDADTANLHHAFLSDANGGTLHDLGTLATGNYSYGLGVNATGQVAGYSTFSSNANAYHAFLSGANGGALHDLGTLGGVSSFGRGVNATGQVAGDADTASGADHAFLSDANGGTLHDLGTLGGNTSVGRGVNATGQVAGYSATIGSGFYHAFLSDPNGGTLHDLGALPTGSSGAIETSHGYGINASGQVVGDGTVNGAFNHALLFSNGMVTDLNTLIAPHPSFTLQEAFGISDNGFITGLCSNGDAFLLTPNAPAVPEASSVISFGLLLALGFGGLLVARRKGVPA